MGKLNMQTDSPLERLDSPAGTCAAVTASLPPPAAGGLPEHFMQQLPTSKLCVVTFRQKERINA